MPPALPDAFDLPVSTGYSQTPHIVALARRLEEDIRQRGLKPGDAYLDLKKSARMLGVSSSTANRALQLLTQRGALTRVQRLGTFVSAPLAATGPADIPPPAGAKPSKEIGCVSVILCDMFAIWQIRRAPPPRGAWVRPGARVTVL